MNHPIPARVLVLLAAVLLAGCASYELMEIPARRADLYPLADRRGGIALAVDHLGDARRSQRFFGADLREHGILPVEVVVSNHGADRVAIGPADVLMLRGSHVIDPLPLESVGEIVKDRFLPVSPGTKREVERALGEVALRQTVVAPGQSYQGVVFFDAVRGEESGAGRFFRMLRAYPRALFQIHVGVTELDSRRRTHFGPFPVYPMERR